MKRSPPPLHPFLLAAYPVLYLLGRGIDEVPIIDAALPLAVAVAGAGVLVVVGTMALKEAPRGAVVASAAIAAFFLHGHLANLLDGARLLGWALPVDGLLFAGWSALLGGALWLAIRRRAAVPGATRVLNVVGVVLVAVALVPTASHLVVTGADVVAGRTPAQADISAGEHPDRDIYYLIFDRYGSRRSLQERFGHDNAEFFGWLAGKGFRVLDSYGNYPKTDLSLAASLNMAYPHDLLEGIAPESTDRRPIHRLIRDHAVGRFLKQHGYTYVHIGSWWTPTTSNDLADRNPRYDRASEFARVLEETTILPAVQRLLGAPEPAVDHRGRHYRAGLFQWQALEQARTLPGRKFVFAHVLLPHEPYVFGEDGSFVPKAAVRDERSGFVTQLRYTNRQLQEFLERLLSGPEETWPIVVLQADEGPHPAAYARRGRTFPWVFATDGELVEKFGILNAFLLPGDDEAAIPPDMTPVNSFRFMLSRYFGADLPLLPDRHIIFRDSGHPYDQIDITDRLRPE